LSTAEAKYVALSYSVQEAIWLRQPISELNGDQVTDATVLYQGNQSAISLMKNPQFHGRAKYIDLGYHYQCERVTDGTILLKYCQSDNMVADMLTKDLHC